MKPALVLYATRHGHAARVAEHVADRLRQAGQPTEVLDVRKIASLDLASHSEVILVASVHSGKHEPEMVAFAKRHRQALDGLPTAFVSISLTEATAEAVASSAEKRAEARKQVDDVMDAFFEETGWHPQRAKAIAGALPYSKYNFVLRFVIKQIAKKSVGDTDTSHDYEYTDWPELDRFIGKMHAGATD